MQKITMLMLVGAVLSGCAVQSQGEEPTENVGETSGAIRDGLDARLEIKSMINTAGAGKCLDLAGGQTTPGSPIVQFSCHRGGNQQFFLSMVTFAGAYQIVSSRDRTKCVGVNAQSATNNALVNLYPCRDATGVAPIGTRWYLNSGDLQAFPTSHIAFRSALPSTSPTGHCIDVASGLNWESLRMQIYSCHGGQNQNWAVTNW